MIKWHLSVGLVVGRTLISVERETNEMYIVYQERSDVSIVDGSKVVRWVLETGNRRKNY